MKVLIFDVTEKGPQLQEVEETNSFGCDLRSMKSALYVVYNEFDSVGGTRKDVSCHHDDRVMEVQGIIDDEGWVFVAVYHKEHGRFSLRFNPEEPKVICPLPKGYGPVTTIVESVRRQSYDIDAQDLAMAVMTQGVVTATTLHLAGAFRQGATLFLTKPELDDVLAENEKTYQHIREENERPYRGGTYVPRFGDP